MIKTFFKTILYIPLYNLLIFFAWLVPGHSIGWAIIILTVLIRLALYPSSAKSVKIQKKIQEMQPELDKIKETHKDDKNAQAQATMQFYTQNKINPLSGCLPLLIQLPILYIMYYVFKVGLDESRFDLLYSFVPHPEKINTLFLGMDLSHPSIYLAVIAGILQFIQAKQVLNKNNSPKKAVTGASDNMGQFQNILTGQMTYFFPVMTVVIAMQLPSALAIYWIITTLFMILQQWWIYKSKNQDVSVKIRKANND